MYLGTKEFRDKAAQLADSKRTSDGESKDSLRGSRGAGSYSSDDEEEGDEGEGQAEEISPRRRRSSDEDVKEEDRRAPLTTSAGALTAAHQKPLSPGQGARSLAVEVEAADEAGSKQSTSFADSTQKESPSKLVSPGIYTILYYSAILLISITICFKYQYLVF